VEVSPSFIIFGVFCPVSKELTVEISPFAFKLYFAFESLVTNYGTAQSIVP